MKPSQRADAKVPPQWSHNQHPCFFQISSAKPSDAGVYVCLAQNALGTAQKRVEVIVDTGTVAPGTPQVQVEEAELTVEAGHTATLRCSATGVDGGWHTGQAEQRALGPEFRHKRPEDYVMLRKGALLLAISQ